MARLNIEEPWWTDPRRLKLGKLLECQYKADGLMNLVWRTAQTYWSNGRRTIPEHVWNAIEHSEKVVQSGLAKIENAEVYVSGTKELLDWYAEKKEEASKAGRISAQKRREKYGTAQPKRQNPEHSPNTDRTEFNKPEPSSSSSSSSSNNINKNITKIEVVSNNEAERKKFPVLPELDFDGINDILCLINPKAQERWIKVYKDTELIKLTAAETISYYTNAGDANDGLWAIRIGRSLDRAFRAQKNANKRGSNNNFDPESDEFWKEVFKEA